MFQKKFGSFFVALLLLGILLNGRSASALEPEPKPNHSKPSQNSPQEAQNVSAGKAGRSTEAAGPGSALSAILNSSQESTGFFSRAKDGVIFMSGTAAQLSLKVSKVGDRLALSASSALGKSDEKGKFQPDDEKSARESLVKYLNDVMGDGKKTEEAKSQALAAFGKEEDVRKWLEEVNEAADLKKAADDKENAEKNSKVAEEKAAEAESDLFSAVTLNEIADRLIPGVGALGGAVTTAQGFAASSKAEAANAAKLEAVQAEKAFESRFASARDRILAAHQKGEKISDSDAVLVAAKSLAVSSAAQIPELERNLLSSTEDEAKAIQALNATKTELNMEFDGANARAENYNFLVGLGNRVFGRDAFSATNFSKDGNYTKAKAQFDAAVTQAKAASARVESVKDQLAKARDAVESPTSLLQNRPTALVEEEKRALKSQFPAAVGSTSESFGPIDATNNASAKTLNDEAQNLYSQAEKGKRVNELSKATTSINGVELDEDTRKKMAGKDVEKVVYVYHNDGPNDVNSRNARDLFVVDKSGKATYLTSIGVEKGAEKVGLAPVAAKPVAPVTKEVATNSIAGLLSSKGLSSLNFPTCDPETGEGCAPPAVPAQASVPTGLPSFRLVPMSQAGGAGDSRLVRSTENPNSSLSGKVPTLPQVQWHNASPTATVGSGSPTQQEKPPQDLVGFTVYGGGLQNCSWCRMAIERGATYDPGTPPEGNPGGVIFKGRDPVYRGINPGNPHPSFGSLSRVVRSR